MDGRLLIQRRSIGLVVLAVIFVVLAVLPLMTERYIIVLFSDILKFIVLTAAWVMFAGPTGYISFGFGRLLRRRSLYIGHP